MPRIAATSNLSTRTARLRLPARHEPHWRSLAEGRAIGYRRLAAGAGKWVARLQVLGEGRRFRALGSADDLGEADGAGVLDFPQAVAAAQAWFAAGGVAEHGDESRQAGPYLVRDAMADYLKWLAGNRKSSETATIAAKAHVLPALGALPIDKVTTARLGAWLEALASKPAKLRTRRGLAQRYRPPGDDAEDEQRRRRATANRVLSIIKAALNRAWKGGKVASDAGWRSVSAYREVDLGRTRYLSDAEALRLVNACPEDFRAMVRAGILTGCRWGELRAAKVGDFAPEAGALLIPTSKSGKSRYIALAPEAAEFFSGLTAGRAAGDPLLRTADGEPWPRWGQHRPMAAACKAAKISPPVTMHTLRHTYASRATIKGVPQPVLSLQLGHGGDGRMTKRYAHLSPAFVSDAIRAAGVPPILPAGPSKVVPLKRRKPSR